MNYKDLSDNSRIWIYQSDRQFSADEVEKIKATGNEFLNTWDSHGKALHAAFEIFHRRFIAIFVDQNHASASGCSIDKSVHFIKQLERDFSVSLFDRMKIAFRDKENVIIGDINELKQKFSDREITENTIVFNNLVVTKSEFIQKWEIPLKESWARKFIAS